MEALSQFKAHVEFFLNVLRGVMLLLDNHKEYSYLMIGVTLIGDTSHHLDNIFEFFRSLASRN